MSVGYLYCYLVGFSSDSVETNLLSLSGFVMGYFMCMVTLNVVSSATSTVYVCFAENPSSLQVFFVFFVFTFSFYG